MPPKSKLNLKDRCEDGELDLSMLDLHEVPVKEIATVKKATSLDLSNNRLTTLGTKFITLTHIVKLDLSKNQLIELPEDFGKLTQLKHLDLYSNKLTHLPLSFSELRNLRWLDLKNNPLVPAVEKAVGPCLDQQQCLQAARQAVKLMTDMCAKVEAERQKQLLQKQLELEQQMEKERQQKKRNDRKKAARLRKKEIKRDAELMHLDYEELRDENVQKHNVPSVAPVFAKKSTGGSTCKCRWLKWMLLGCLVWVVSATGRWSVDVRNGVNSVWSGHVAVVLPEGAVIRVEMLGEWLTWLHKSTGEHVQNLPAILKEAAESRHVKDAMEMASSTFEVFKNKSAQLYTSLHHVTVSLLDEIKKRTT